MRGGVGQQRSQVLRQACAAERESRLQIGGGDVQLVIAAEDVHDLMAVGADRLADAADLVGETHLQRVPRVVHVLDHLGGLEIGAHERTGEPVIEFRQHLAACAVQLTDHGLRRIQEVVHRGALAQELGVHAQPEIDSGSPPGRGLERRDHHVARRSRQHRAADCDHRRTGMLSQRRTDLLAYSAHVRQIDSPVATRGRTDADQSQVGQLDRRRQIRRRGQPLAANLFRDE